MAGDGFTVDYGGLEELGDTLESLAHEFDGMEDMMDAHGEAMGAPPGEIGFLSGETVANRLERVGSNWSDDRGEIVEGMETAADYAKQAAAAYRDLDTGLADEFAG